MLEPYIKLRYPQEKQPSKFITLSPSGIEACIHLTAERIQTQNLIVSPNPRHIVLGQIISRSFETHQLLSTSLTRPSIPAQLRETAYAYGFTSADIRAAAGIGIQRSIRQNEFADRFIRPILRYLPKGSSSAPLIET